MRLRLSLLVSAACLSCAVAMLAAPAAFSQQSAAEQAVPAVVASVAPHEVAEDRFPVEAVPKPAPTSERAVLSSAGAAATAADMGKDMDSLPASEALGDALAARGRYLAAMRVFDRVQPRSAVIANKAGVSSEHMLMFDKAKLNFEEALRLDPKYAEAMNNLATVYHSRGDLGRAEKLYKKAIQIKPTSADSWQNLGALYYSKRKFKKGDEAFREALRQDPGILERTTSRGIHANGSKQNNAEMHYHLACTFAQAGRTSAALDYLRRSIVEGFHDSNRMLHETMLADLRTSPAFLQMVEDMKKN